MTYMSTAARGATPHGARRRRSSPAFGLDVMYMRMLPDLDRRDDFADVDAVLDDGVTHIHIFQCDLVAKRDVLGAGQRYGAVLVENQPGQGLPGLHALGDDDGDGIPGVMQNIMNHSAAPLRPRTLTGPDDTASDENWNSSR